MRTGKKKSGIESVIFWVLMVLVILAGLGAIAYFAAREQGVTKYVEYNGQKYYGNADVKSVGRMLGDTYTFGVRSTDSRMRGRVRTTIPTCST